MVQERAKLLARCLGLCFDRALFCFSFDASRALRGTVRTLAIARGGENWSDSSENCTKKLEQAAAAMAMKGRLLLCLAITLVLFIAGRAEESVEKGPAVPSADGETSHEPYEFFQKKPVSWVGESAFQHSPAP